MATELAQAYVQIVPSADGIQDKLASAMGSGESLGSSYGASLGKGIGTALKGSAAIVAGLATAATAAAKGLFDSANATAQAGDEIDKQSQKMGVTAEQYQTLGFAAEHSGISISKFKMAADKVSASDFGGNIYEYVESLQAIEDPAERAAQASAMFGERTANELAPLLNGSETLSEYADELQNLGGVMSDEAVKNSAAFQDSLTNLNTSMEGFKNQIMADALPGITSFMDGLTGLVAGSNGAEKKLTEGASSIVNSVTTMIPKLLTFVQSVATAVLQAAPQIITSLASGIIQAIPQLAPTLSTVVVQITQSLVSMLPQLMSAGVEVIKSLIDGITSAIPTLIPLIVEVVSEISQVLLQNVPTLLEAGITLFLTLADALVDAIPLLLNELPKLIQGILDALGKSMPLILDAGLKLFMGLVEALPVVIDSLVKMLPQLIQSLINYFIENAPTVYKAAFDLLVGIVKAIPGIVLELLKALPQIVSAIIEGIAPAIDGIAQWGEKMSNKAATGAKKVWDTLVNTFRDIGQRFWDIGKNMVQGLWNGIKSAWTWLTDQVAKICEKLVGAAKSALGIHSPSTVFRDVIGKNLALGIGEGFTDEMDNVNADIDKSLQRTYSVNPTVTTGTIGEYSGNIIQRQLNDVFGSINGTMQQAPTIENVVKIDSETLYKMVQKGERAYNGRYNTQVAF